MKNSESNMKCIGECDLIWEEHGHRAETNEDGSYISIDNPTVERLGQDLGDMKSPGAFRSFSDNSGRERYFLKGLGHGRYNLFRR